MIPAVALAVLLLFFGGWESAASLWHLTHGDATWGRAAALAAGLGAIALAVWCFDKARP